MRGVSRARERPGESGTAPAVQSTYVGAEPTWEGERKARTRKREWERGGARPTWEKEKEGAHARERARGGARPTREKEQEGAQGPRERERVGSEPTVPHQKGQCDREKAVKEWAPPECSGIGWLTKRDNETRMTDKNCGVVWVGGKRSSTKESCAHHKRFQRKLMLQSLECTYYRSQRPTVALAACQRGECSVCSLTIVCLLTALAACQRGKCSVCSLTIVCSLKLSCNPWRHGSLQPGTVKLSRWRHGLPPPSFNDPAF